MSKCAYCGNELLAGDVRWDLGICNNCYNKININHTEWEMVELLYDEINQLQIYELKQQLAEKDKEIERLKIITDAIKKIEDAGLDIKNYIFIDNKSIRELVCEEIEHSAIFCHISGETYYKIYPEDLKRIKEKKDEN